MRLFPRYPVRPRVTESQSLPWYHLDGHQADLGDTLKVYSKNGDEIEKSTAYDTLIITE